MAAAGERRARPIYTVGHSNHSSEDFIRLLSSCGVETLVDVRSMPYSRHVLHFNREALRGFIEACGITYIYMGDTLGGMPEDRNMYDGGGKVLYSQLARTEGFARGVDELRSLARKRCVAIMCSEENPRDCHRSLLIGRILAQAGMEVAHIRGDGKLESDDPEDPAGQTEMFPAKEEEWKSIRSVLPADRRRNSSRR